MFALQAVDVFAAYSTSVENRLKMMKEIARLWSIDNVGTLYPVDKPVIQVRACVSLTE